MLGSPADCQSAKRQIANLRYGASAGLGARMQFAAGEKEFHVGLAAVEHRSTRKGTLVFDVMPTKTKRSSFESGGLPRPSRLPTETVKLTADLGYPKRNVPASADLANSLSPREKTRVRENGTHYHSRQRGRP